MVETEILKFLMSAAGGALLGGAFGLANKLLDMRSEAGKNEHELNLRRMDIRQMQIEFKGRATVITTEAAPADGSLVASYEHDLKGSSRKAAAFRAIVRPALTGALTMAAIVMNGYLIGMLHLGWSDFTQTQRFGIIWSAIDWVGFQASTVVSWWFGARGARPERGGA